MREKAGRIDTMGLSLAGLAFPIFMENMLRSLLGTVNTFILSRYSDAAVAAVGVANQYMNMVIILFTVMSGGMGVLLSQNLGAGRRDEASRVCCAAAAVNGALGAALGLAVLLFSREIVQWMGLDEELESYASQYMKVLSLSMLLTALTSTLSVIYRNYGNAAVPMAAMVLTNVVNVVLSWVVVMRPGVLPWEGTRGVAFARLIGECAGFAALSALLPAMNRSWGIDFSQLRAVKARVALRIARLGAMTGVEGLCYNAAALLTTAMVTPFGQQTLSAKVYVNNVVYYVYIVGMSIGNATQIICGRLAGAGRQDDLYRYAWRSWRRGFASNMGFSLLALALSPLIYGAFTDDPAVVAICCGVMKIDLAIQAGRSFNHNIKGALQGAGYVKAPMILAASSILLLNVGLGYVLCSACGLGLNGIWAAMAADEVVRGIGNAFLIRKGNWRASALAGPAARGAGRQA